MSGRLAGRLLAPQTVQVGYALMFSGVALNTLIVSFVPPGVPWHVLPIMIFTTGSALMTPSVTLLLLDLFPAMRGLASSLQGFVQFAFSGIVAGTIAPFLARSLEALLAGMADVDMADSPADLARTCSEGIVIVQPLAPEDARAQIAGPAKGFPFSSDGTGSRSRAFVLRGPPTVRHR